MSRVSATQAAKSAYESGPAEIRPARYVEIEAFTRVTRQLRAVAENDARLDTDVATAIHRNRELWSLLAQDVANPRNGLPSQLRASIFYLAEFTHHHSRLVLKGQAQIAPLCDINQTIMAGLTEGMSAR